MGCKSPTVNFPIQTVSISEPSEGNLSRPARMEKPRLPNVETHCGRNNLGGEQTFGPEHLRMTAPPKVATRLKLSFWNEAKRRPVSNAGKAEVLWEETGKCTTEAAGVGVQGRRKRFAEITSGRSLSQQRLTATCKDSLPRKIHRQWEGLGLAHEPVSDERGATPSDVAWNAMALKVTPWVCKGALGTWQFQEYPDTERPVNNGRTAEANQYEQGCL